MISTNSYINIVFWLTYVIAIVVGTEVFAYLWHRYGAHADYIPGIHDTHRIHHIMKLEAGHEADEDFVWILLLMIIFEIFISIGVMIGIIPGLLAIITIVVALIVFWWNWWIHRAYHDPNHWLNLYDWFLQEKARHYVHHDHPTINYGIASHFTDRFFSTWSEPNLQSDVL